jgi:DNA-binding transcriptional LysR family regulator
MDQRRLKCFVALAEELNFHRAAARMHMTQPAISQHLRALEDDLRVQLVHRNRRAVTLTRAGEVFLEEARKLLQQSEYAVQLARRTDRGEVGQLVVGLTQPAFFIVFPEIVQAFRARLPDVGIVIQEMTTAQQEQALRAGTIHVGILHPPLDDAALACRPFAKVAFDIVLPARHPLARKRTIALTDLAKEHFILFPRRIAPRLYDQIIALCQECGFSPEIVAESAPAQSIIAHAAAGFGVGFIASSFQQANRPGVVYRRLQGRTPEMIFGVASQIDELSLAVRTFVDVASAVGSTIFPSTHGASERAR